ncbi:TPA: hypothetical protein GDO54_018645 [Pyxicephalus adspersus]|uniref:Olfactory receptor n=1 Tax=Pyxicephalus adspersus TaxID=30357 RepID=A0AAV2ZNU6_PYXAD|nr:TPA: hypothetical protein GDO54_018645 [Pyxicephalus adspersus]
MAIKNQTIATEIILLGFTFDPTINIVLLFLFCIIYKVTFVGNGLIIFVILTNPHLHVPMYYFLCVLCFLDLSHSSTVVPWWMADLLSSDRIISLGGCITQIYVIEFLEGCECLLLAIMAYDRYVAISQPLHYTVLMHWNICYRFTATIVFLSAMICLFPSIFLHVALCGNQINHFMCELLAVLTLSCEDISTIEVLIFSISFLSLFLPFILIIISYAFILFSVLKIQSAGRSKAWSSHVAVVVLYFGTVMLMYFGPSSQYSTNQEKYSSIFYAVVSPMLNPIIYSLNNREVKETFLKMLSKVTSSAMTW